jgi:hypothetical protein
MGAVKGITQAIAATDSETAKAISGMLLISACISGVVLAWPFLPVII